MLGLEDLHFSNLDLIFHLNSMPRACGSLETTDSTAHAISRWECGLVTEKFKPFIRTASSESVRTSLERLRINFLEAEAGVDKTLVLRGENLRIFIAFCLLKMFLNELSTAATVPSNSECYIPSTKPFRI
jgi:hypothetical protein